MKKRIGLIVCILLLLAMTACAGESSAANNDQTDANPEATLSETKDDQNETAPEKTLSGLNAWYGLIMGMDDYEMFQANYGDIITEDFYDELAKLYDRTNTDETNVCLLHTLSDGTRVLLILEADPFWNEFKLKSIEIID